MKSKNIHTRISIIFFISILITFFYGCGKKLPEDIPIGVKDIVLLNQDSSRIIFPDSFKGKTLLLSFIYTNCPDICPMTTHNMQLIQQQVKKEGIDNVEFVEISFDPLRDTPSKLKEFGDIRDIDYNNFNFLTGNPVGIKSILNNMNILALPGDTTETKSGSKIYFFTHTDRITLIDKNGRIRNEYRGSKANIQAVVNDIKILGD